MISVVELDYFRVGYEAAELLDELMQGKSPANPHRREPPRRILQRQSTDAFLCGDPLVEEALRYIADHSQGPLRVEDVAAALNTSKATLWRRFNEVLGHRVGQRVPADDAHHLHAYDLAIDREMLHGGDRRLPVSRRLEDHGEGLFPCLAFLSDREHLGLLTVVAIFRLGGRRPQCGRGKARSAPAGTKRCMNRGPRSTRNVARTAPAMAAVVSAFSKKRQPAGPRSPTVISRGRVLGKSRAPPPAVKEIVARYGNVERTPLVIEITNARDDLQLVLD